MESKLPKPSGIKRPALTIVPMDRIKKNVSIEPTASLLYKTAPDFSKAFINFQDIRGRRRAVSPDSKSSQSVHKDITNFQGFLPSRAKLRRSRSACDIIALKKAGTIPDKLSQIKEIPTTSNTRQVGRIGGIAAKSATGAYKPKTIACSAVNQKKMNLSAQSVVKPTMKKEPIKAGPSSTSTSTTGGGKPINKRIPPYDFKARYHDLLEKHKTLKDKYQQAVDQLESFENLPEQFEKCQTELEVTKQELQSTLEENSSLQQQALSLNTQLNSVTTNFTKCKEVRDLLQESLDSLKKAHLDLAKECEEFKEANEKLLSENKHLHDDLQICREQLFRSFAERKILHNDLMDLRGNIRVFCRVRPPLANELDKPLCEWNYIDEATVEIVNHELLSKNKQGTHTFNFDYVFHPRSRQEDVFENVSPLIQSAMDGYNICIFAYGQTGSGKTYTMDGTTASVGVIPRTVDLLFESVESYKSLGWIYTIKVTFLEIYNEVLYDLLSNEQKDMDIRMATTNKNDIYVTNITEEIVDSAEQLRHLMGIAKSNRATAATVGNERSSRSHAVTRLVLSGYHADKNEYSVGTINLVDLAGSESPKTSQRMTETKNINRSLSELTNVILALLQKQDHIPYRNSKLTHLLMPSLGGNSKTLMFINVAPFLECYVESVKSLRFAASVNSCKTKAKRNRYLVNSSN